jgi:transposase
MQRLQAFKFEVLPNGEQERNMRRFAGACRFVYNQAVRSLCKSSAGTAENPGRNVRAKAGLNKSILDQGWFEFRRQLEYKLQWAGGTLIAVPPQNTSQQCPVCGIPRLQAGEDVNNGFNILNSTSVRTIRASLTKEAT